LALLVYFLYDLIAVLNFQVASITSSILIYLTYFSYKKSVEYKASIYDDSGRDILDKMNDEFELFEKEDIKESKKDSMITNGVKNFPLFVSFYRIAGYAILGMGFYVLVSQNILYLPTYLAGISMLPISAMIYLAFFNK
jgi:hypothetical protein